MNRDLAARSDADDEAQAEAGGLDLVVPIYLDTSAMLDLLASVEGGFSMVERLATHETQTSETGHSVAGEFGVGGVLNNLLKINLGGERSRRGTEAAGQQRESERYHTYGSLLYRLRELLNSGGNVKRLSGTEESWADIRPSDFVELRGVVHPNPMAESLGTIIRLMRLIRLTAGLADEQPQNRKAQKAQVKELDQIRKFLEEVLSDIERDDVNLFVTDLLDTDGRKKVVSPLFTEYLRDPTLTELSYGEFKMLGKVVRKLTDTGDDIDLLRGTAVGGLGDEMLGKLIDAFQAVEAEGLQLPKITTRIEAPALQVAPVAIYV